MEIIAEKRDLKGKKTKQLRIDNLVPAVIFGKGLESEDVSINATEFTKVYGMAGETSLVDIKLGIDKVKVLINEVQYHPVTHDVIHVSFYKPDLKVKTRVNVPVEVINVEENPLIKSGEAMILNILSEVEVEALPTDLPHSFTVDALTLVNLGDGIKVSDLNYDKEKVEIVGVEADDLVIKLDAAEHQTVEDQTLTPEEAEKAALEAVEATAEKKEEETAEATE